MDEDASVELLMIKARELSLQEPDERKPYEYKYAAAEQLKIAIDRLTATLGVGSQPIAAAGADAVASPSLITTSAATPDASPTTAVPGAGEGGEDVGKAAAPDAGQGHSASAVIPPPVSSSMSPASAAIVHARALLSARRGVILMETDLSAEGQAAVEFALSTLEGEVGAMKKEGPPGESDPPEERKERRRDLAVLQECYNSLGALKSGQGELGEALKWLTKAEEVYKRHRGGSRGRHEQQQKQEQRPQACASDAGVTTSSDDNVNNDQSVSISDQLAGAKDVTSSEEDREERGALSASVPPTSPPASPLLTWDDVEINYTSTLFYLAQVHGHAERGSLSARYCAATLKRQLESGQYQLNEWVQNCMQLAGYYTSTRAFAISHHFLAAASAVAAGRKAKEDGVAAAAPGPPEGSASLSSSSPAGDDGSAEASATPGPHRPPPSLPPCGPSPSSLLDPDIAANMDLAWGKHHLQRIVASYEKVVEGVDVVMPTPDQYPDMVYFSSIEGLPSPLSLTWGQEAILKTFEQAREAFNTGMMHFKAALEYYQLDGWVTEHCNIVMEISNMFRCLAGFEPDLKRRRIMHKLRAARLEPLHGALNPEFFLGLVRSIALELGNISREVMDLHEAEGSKASAKEMASARRDAVKYYQAFLDTFRDSATGQLPETRIADEATERYFLLASFSLGRCLSVRATDRDIEAMIRGCIHLRWAADYVRKHDVSSFSREAGMAVEMAGLIAEKIELTKRVAATGGGR